MRIIRDYEAPEKGTAVTIGMFDGVHLGHRKVIETLRKISAEQGLTPLLVTFYPHPLIVVHPERAPLRLTTEHDKLCLLESLGVETVIRLPFSLELSRKSPEQFLKEYLVEKWKCKVVVVGYDHGFGRNRKGGVDFLQRMADEYGFDLIVVEPFSINNKIVSSTMIRKALARGDVADAAEMLGRPYELSGLVVSGQGRGRKIGFPTANIDVPDQKKLIPADGVYAVMVSYEGKWFKGMLNIGFRPTFGGNNRTVEVNIFDFSRYILGRLVNIQFIERVRDEIRFSGEKEIVKQLEIDRRNVLNILKKKLDFTQSLSS